MPSPREFYSLLIDKIIITAMSNGNHGVSKCRTIECLFDSLIRLTTKKHQKSALLSLCKENPPVTGEIPEKGTLTWKMFPFDDVIMVLYDCSISGIWYYRVLLEYVMAGLDRIRDKSTALSWMVHQSYQLLNDVPPLHYNDVIMNTMASQITSLMIVYSTVYSGEDQRKHQSFASLAFVWEIQRGPVNSPHKGPVTQNMFPFDDVIMSPTKIHA